MTRLTAQEVQAFLRRDFPQTSSVIEHVGDMTATVRQKITEAHLRPGNTVSGPTLMALADHATYVAILSHIGIVPLAVTTNLSITFMRKPAPGVDLLATAKLLKIGARLAVAEVHLRSASSPDILAQATVTYSIPPSDRRDPE